MPFATTPSGDLHYDICDLTPPWVDDPETIIFHHGVAAHAAIWTDWLGVLAGKYRLVRFDLRGYGESVKPDADHEWSFSELVDDLICVADAVDAKKFHIVGESIGATTAIAYALSSQKARLLSMTVSNGSAKGGLLGNVNVWREMANTGGQKKWAAQMMEWRFYPGAIDPRTFHWYLNLHETCSMDACLGLADMLLAADFTKDLGQIRVPTLLMSPDNSPFVPAKVMADMREEITDAELEVFANSRHGLPLSHGKACARVLENFLSRRT
jgi:pimeloyl-ACP methyl ester carboxylesterase